MPTEFGQSKYVEVSIIQLSCSMSWSGYDPFITAYCQGATNLVDRDWDNKAGSFCIDTPIESLGVWRLLQSYVEEFTLAKEASGKSQSQQIIVLAIWEGVQNQVIKKQ